VLFNPKRAFLPLQFTCFVVLHFRQRNALFAVLYETAETSRTRRNDMLWYAVKLLYRMEVSGEPKASLLDDFYSGLDLFFEESVLLVPAGSFEEAYEKAETEAKKKANVYENKYGQTVTVGFYKSVDCFALFESPQAFTEAYSAIFCGTQPDIARRYERCTAEEMHVLRQK